MTERYCDCVSTDARALCDLMSDTSEHCWCAGWLAGTEYSLYQMAFCGSATQWGMNTVTPAVLAELRRLAEVSDSWWHWPDDLHDGPVRISLDEAALLYGQPE